MIPTTGVPGSSKHRQAPPWTVQSATKFRRDRLVGHQGDPGSRGLIAAPSDKLGHLGSLASSNSDPFGLLVVRPGQAREAVGLPEGRRLTGWRVLLRQLGMRHPSSSLRVGLPRARSRGASIAIRPGWPTMNCPEPPPESASTTASGRSRTVYAECRLPVDESGSS